MIVSSRTIDFWLFTDAQSVILQQGVNQVHEVAACLKLFLRSLKDPLLMSSKYNSWIENAGKSSSCHPSKAKPINLAFSGLQIAYVGAVLKASIFINNESCLHLKKKFKFDTHFFFHSN